MHPRTAPGRSRSARRPAPEVPVEKTTERIQADRLHIEIGRTYPLAEAAEAHRAIERRRTTGKILLAP